MKKGQTIMAPLRVKDDILQAIVAEIQKQAVQPPPGFHQISYWEARWKCKRSCVKRYLAEGVKAGILERIELRNHSGRYIRRVPFYGPARKKTRQEPPS